MRYRLRTLLIVLALGPPVLAGMWRAARVLVAVGPEVVAVWLFATPILALLLGPLWIPLVYLACLIRVGDFKIWPVVHFTFFDVWSICVSGFILENLSDCETPA
jgi:hypothetical protein